MGKSRLLMVSIFFVFLISLDNITAYELKCTIIPLPENYEAIVTGKDFYFKVEVKNLENTTFPGAAAKVVIHQQNNSILDQIEFKIPELTIENSSYVWIPNSSREGYTHRVWEIHPGQEGSWKIKVIFASKDNQAINVHFGSESFTNECHIGFPVMDLASYEKSKLRDETSRTQQEYSTEQSDNLLFFIISAILPVYLVLNWIRGFFGKIKWMDYIVIGSTTFIVALIGLSNVSKILSETLSYIPSFVLIAIILVIIVLSCYDAIKHRRKNEKCLEWQNSLKYHLSNSIMLFDKNREKALREIEKAKELLIETLNSPRYRDRILNDVPSLNYRFWTKFKLFPEGDIEEIKMDQLPKLIIALGAICETSKKSESSVPIKNAILDVYKKIANESSILLELYSNDIYPPKKGVDKKLLKEDLKFVRMHESPGKIEMLLSKKVVKGFTTLRAIFMAVLILIISGVNIYVGVILSIFPLAALASQVTSGVFSIYSLTLLLLAIFGIMLLIFYGRIIYQYLLTIRRILFNRSGIRVKAKIFNKAYERLTRNKYKNDPNFLYDVIGLISEIIPSKHHTILNIVFAGKHSVPILTALSESYKEDLDEKEKRKLKSLLKKRSWSKEQIIEILDVLNRKKLDDDLNIIPELSKRLCKILIYANYTRDSPYLIYFD